MGGRTDDPRGEGSRTAATCHPAGGASGQRHASLRETGIDLMAARCTVPRSRSVVPLPSLPTFPLIAGATVRVYHPGPACTLSTECTSTRVRFSTALLRRFPVGLEHDHEFRKWSRSTPDTSGSLCTRRAVVHREQGRHRPSSLPAARQLLRWLSTPEAGCPRADLRVEHPRVTTDSASRIGSPFRCSNRLPGGPDGPKPKRATPR